MFEHKKNNERKNQGVYVLSVRV